MTRQEREALDNQLFPLFPPEDPDEEYINDLVIGISLERARERFYLRHPEEKLTKSVRYYKEASEDHPLCSTPCSTPCFFRRSNHG